jgi:enterochelin esterase family protein
MKKGKDGVWEYTTPQLTSEMFTYRFDVDGVVYFEQ